MSKIIKTSLILSMGLISTNLINAESLKIRAIGESTSLGYYNGIDHPTNSEASIPIMVKNAINSVNVELENRAKDSTSVDWHLGRQDGDENYHEPSLQTDDHGNYTPSATPYELAKSKATVVTIQLGINDAVSIESLSEFSDDFSELIENCKRTGKKIYITMPNKITDGNNNRLSYMANIMKNIGYSKDIIVVNSGIQNVTLFDNYHPIAGFNGYIKLGNALKNKVAYDAKNILNHLTVTRYYIAMFNRTPEKGGLDYWANLLNSKSRNKVAQAIVHATEANENEVMTDSEFIDRIYNNLMNREPDAEGKAYWLNRLNTYNTNARGALMNELIDLLINYNGTVGQTIKDKKVLQNKTSVGFAYGYIYGKEDVASSDNFSMLGVTDDYNSVYSATVNF